MRFRVAAPGAPLGPGERLNVFEPYGRQLAGAAGYGLGLALARAVIELHEGRIWVEELAGGGWAFVFELGLPQARSVGRAEPPSGTSGAGGRAREGTASPAVET